jgi:hypothetical protein
MGTDDITRQHRCLGTKFYAPNRFRYDDEALLALEPEEDEISDCEEEVSELSLSIIFLNFHFAGYLTCCLIDIIVILFVISGEVLFFFLLTAA